MIKSNKGLLFFLKWNNIVLLLQDWPIHPDLQPIHDPFWMLQMLSLQLRGHGMLQLLPYTSDWLQPILSKQGWLIVFLNTFWKKSNDILKRCFINVGLFYKLNYILFPGIIFLDMVYGQNICYISWLLKFFIYNCSKHFILALTSKWVHISIFAKKTILRGL